MQVWGYMYLAVRPALKCIGHTQVRLDPAAAVAAAARQLWLSI